MSTDSSGARRGVVTRIAVFAILAILAALLAGANVVQPPRLSSIDANTALLVARGEQRVQLHLSQPVAEVSADAVTVRPSTPVTVSSSGGTITLQFPDMLNTGTRYEIDARVRGSATGSSGTVTAEFTTPDPATYTLVRSPDGDRLLEHRVLQPSSTRTVFTAPRIQEYTPTASGLAAVTRDPEGAAELSIYAGVLGAPGAGPDGATPDPAPDADPDPGTATATAPADAASAERFRIMGANDLGQLRSEPSTGVVGIVASGTGDDGTQYDRTLIVIDPETVIVSTVTDDAGAPLHVRDWRFIPGTTSLVLQDAAGRLFGWEAAPTPRSFPLDVTGDLLGFVPGRTQLAVGTARGAELLDLAGIVSGTLDGAPPAEPLPWPIATGADPQPDADDTVARSTTEVLARLSRGTETSGVGTGSAPTRIDVRSAGSHLGDGSLATDARVVVADPEGERQIFAPASPTTRIGRVCLSPNAEFVSIESVSTEGQPDGAPIAPGSSNTTTAFVRVSTGETVRSVIGGLSDWCR